MTKRKVDESQRSTRERDHDAMLKAALARPGVREAMEVYGNWQEKDREMEAYRSVTQDSEQFTTTNHSNVR